MKPSRGRRWWLGALAFFLGLLGIWVLAVLQLMPANAHPRALGLDLLSHLRADYGADAPRVPLAALRLSIVGEALADLGLPAGQAQERQQGVETAMLVAVPTATPRPTETSTATPMPTTLPTDETIPTSPPEPTATETPQSTSAPIETATPQTVTATPGPSPTQCYANPFVQILMPGGSPIYRIGDSIPVQAFAYDPDNVDPGSCQLPGVYPADDGEGIDRVEFEIWRGNSKVYSRTESSPAYCGWGGSAPCATRPVSSLGWPAGQYLLRARSRDTGGHYSDWAVVYFTLDIPSPTATATRTPTRTRTPTPTRTPTRTTPAPLTQSPTHTATLTATPTPTATGTATSTATHTATASPTTETPSPTPTYTDTPSATPTEIPSPSPTPSYTPSPTATS